MSTELENLIRQYNDLRAQFKNQPPLTHWSHSVEELKRTISMCQFLIEMRKRER